MIQRFKNVVAGMGKFKFWYLWGLIDLVPVVTVGVLNFTVFNDFPRIFAVTACLVMTLGIAHVLSLFQQAASLDPVLKDKLWKTEAWIAIVLYINLGVHVAVAGHVSSLRELSREANTAIAYNDQTTSYNNDIARQESEWQDRRTRGIEALNKSASELERSQQAKLDAARRLYGQTGQLKVGQAKGGGTAEDLGEAPKFERRQLKPVPLVDETEAQFLIKMKWIFVAIAFLDLAVSMVGGHGFKHVYTEDKDGDGKADWEKRARERGISQKLINKAKPKGWISSLFTGSDHSAKVTAKKSPHSNFDAEREIEKVTAEEIEESDRQEVTAEVDLDVAKEVDLNSLPDRPHAVSEKVTAKVTARSHRQENKKVTAKSEKKSPPARVKSHRQKSPPKVTAKPLKAKLEPARREGNRWIIHDMALPHVVGCRWEARPKFVANLWILGKPKDASGYVDSIGKRDLLKYREMFEDERFKAVQERVAEKLKGREVGPDE